MDEVTDAYARSRPIEPVNTRLPISPQVYERLRRAITTLVLLPSEALSEKELALQLGVSRTPVREALIRLADEGLIDILPQRGSFVAPIRLPDVEEAQLIREALEVAVVRKVAVRHGAAFLSGMRANLARQADAVSASDWDLFYDLDEKFHQSFCAEAGLQRSWRLIQTVKLQMDRVRYLSFRNPEHLETLLRQHRAIVSAAEAMNARAAASAMATHLQEVLGTVRRLSAAQPDLFAR